MKAITHRKYGPPEVLHLEEASTPEPKDNEIRVRVHATSVNYGDLAARNFRALSLRDFNMPALFWLIAKISFGLWKPRNGILGSEFSGTVDAVGNAVTQFAAGDDVFGYLGQDMGAYAEQFCMAEDGCVAARPSAMSHEEAAVVPYGAIMALHLLRKADVQPGDRVLINGASGSIGSAAVQIAKQLGAHGR